MINIRSLIMVFVLLSVAGSLYSQKDKPGKEARKMAKKWEKEGWLTRSDSPIANQFEDYWIRQLQENKNMMPVYMAAEGQMSNKRQDIARQIALDIAKRNCASLMFSQVESLVENRLGNSRLSGEQGDQASRFLARSKTIVSGHIPDYEVMIDLYRSTEDGKIESYVAIVIDRDLYLSALQEKLLEQAGGDPDLDDEFIRDVLKDE